MRSWERTEKGAQVAMGGAHRLWVGRLRPVSRPHLLRGEALRWQDRACAGAPLLRHDRRGRRGCPGAEHAETSGTPSLAREARPPRRGAEHDVPSSARQPASSHFTSPPCGPSSTSEATEDQNGKERPAATHLYDHILLSRPQVLSHTSPSDLARPPGGTLAGGAWGNAVSQRAHRKEVGSLVGQGGFGWVAH